MNCHFNNLQPLKSKRMEQKIKTYKNSSLINEDFKTVKLPKLRDEFISKLENALMFLNYDNYNMYHSEAKKSVHLKQFDGAYLIDVSLKHDDKEGFTYQPFTDLQVTPNMYPNLNIKLMNLGGEIATLSKVRFLQTKEKRNITASKKYRYLYDEKFSFLDYGEQKWWSNSNSYGFNKVEKTNDYKIILPKPISLYDSFYIKDKDSIKYMIDGINDIKSPYWNSIKTLHLSLNLAMTYEYEWSVYIRENDNCLGVRIPIHPSASKKVFMLRNIPEGNKRKKAIVNFVKEHYRTVNDYNNEERKILIKKHLRGELKFNWRGLQVNIIPSSYDLKHIKTSKKILNI